MKTELLDIRHMDCMDLMAEFPDNHFDLAVVDPPYGIGINDQFGKACKSKSSMFNQSKGVSENGEWDNATPSTEYFTELERVSKDRVIWGGNYFLDFLPSTKCFLSWDKMNGTNNMADFELAWTSFNKSCRRFSMHHFSAGYGEKIHICQKPIKLYDWIFANYAEKGMKILDTHLGSGSSAIASHYAGMHMTACELDEDYYKAACERIKANTQQLSLF